MTAFGRINVALNNVAAFDPTSTSDSVQGYSVGSTWINSATFAAYQCIDATAGAAQWMPTSSRTAVGKISQANMNITTDQAFVFPFGAGRKFVVSSIIASNPSLSMTTAAGGIYTAAAKGGTAIVAAAQVYTGLTAAGTRMALTLAAANATLLCNAPIFLNLTTGQGAAATADFYIFGDFVYA